MSIRIVVAGLLLALSCYLGGQVALAQEAEKRDLSRYERGPEPTLRHWYGSMVDDEEGAKARVREFLWKQWREKRLTRCAITVSYTHGEGQTTHYYVEPNSGGQWRVAVESESSGGFHQAAQGEDITPKTTVVGTYTIVSRVDAMSGRPVPEKEKRKPESYTLLLSEGKPGAKDEVGPSNTLKL